MGLFSPLSCEFSVILGKHHYYVHVTPVDLYVEHTDHPCEETCGGLRKAEARKILSKIQELTREVDFHA